MGIVCICPFIQKQNGEKQASIRYKQHMLHEQHDTELICSVPFFSECTEGPAIRRDLLNGCRIRIEFFVYYCCCCRSYCYSSYCSLVDFIHTIYADNSFSFFFSYKFTLFLLWPSFGLFHPIFQFWRVYLFLALTKKTKTAKQHTLRY